MALELLYDDEYDDSFDELAEVKGVGAAAGSSADDDAIGGGGGGRPFFSFIRDCLLIQYPVQK